MAPQSKWGKATHPRTRTHAHAGTTPVHVTGCAWAPHPWRPPRQGSWTAPSSGLTMSLLPPHTCPEISRTEADTLLEHSTAGSGGRSSLLTAQGGVCRWAVHHPPAKAQPPGPGHPQAPALQQPESGGHKTEVSRGTEMTVSTADQAPWKRAPPSPEVFEPSSRA